jgi:hypothetical protein
MNDRKTRKRHPGFESLEAMELLSGAGFAASDTLIRPHPAMTHRASDPPVADVALNLSGTLQGTYRVVGGGKVATFTGRGGVSPVGAAQLRGRIAFSAASAGGQFTLKFGRRGAINAAVTGTPTQGKYTYQIEGGTRTFAGDSGSGTAIVSIVSSNGAGTRGLFMMNLQGTPST